MKVGIVGASAAGLYTAILIKQKHHDFSVDVFDKEEKVGKKLRATGNGHCNLLNRKARYSDFNHPFRLKDYFEKFPVSSLISVLESMGVSLKKIGDLLYPECFSAPSYVEFLYGTALNLGVNFHLGLKVENYNGTSLLANGKKYNFDRLVFACGGVAQPNLGSDGSLFPVFKKHGYTLIPFQPGLAPIVVKENVKMLQGVRHDVDITVYQKDTLIYKEGGELLFKKDGLSGIVIFNTQRAIAHLEDKKDVTIHVNLFPNISKEELAQRIENVRSSNPDLFLNCLFEKNLNEYFKKTVNVNKTTAFVDFLQDWVFHFASSYGFDACQIAIGGVSLNDVSESLESKKEKGVYFAGEALDVDGKCGGFNLTWCLLSALIVTEAI